jgi:hypothetical protein
MKTYINKKGNSGVKAYENGVDYIIVQFGDWYYLYTTNNPGIQEVKEMNRLAEQGKDLSTYITQNIKTEFEKKSKDLVEIRNYLRSKNN